MSSDVYVVFSSGERRWWNFFLHPIISHCELLIPYNGQWIVYGKSYEQIDLFIQNDYGDIIHESVVVKAKAQNAKRGLFMLNTCVGQVKQYLGIRKPFIWTPYQLLKYLRCNHGKQPETAKANSRAKSIRKTSKHVIG